MIGLNMNVYIPNLRLPSAYQEVEYIQSSGTQYIKIGTSFKTSYKIVIDFQMTVTGGDYVPIGVRTADGGNKRYGIDAWNSYFKVIAGGGDWNNTIAEDTNRHTITLDKSTAIVDGTSYSVQYADWTFNDGIGVFYYHKIGETPYVDAISSNKLYKLDIYDENGTHINELIPCYRKSDGVIGLYDLVNSVFYTNSGTGTFSKGNDVTMAELKNAYIGEYHREWTPDSIRTLLYLPLESDTNDYSGNNRTCTPTSVTFTTVGGVQSAHVGTTGGIAVTPTNFITTSTKYKTTSVLVYVTSLQTSARRTVREWAIQNVEFHGLNIKENTNGNINIFSGNTSGMDLSSVITPNTWILITETLGNGVHKVYVNGTLINTVTYTSTLPAWGNRTNSYQQSQTMLNSRNGVSTSQGLNGNVREIIFENILWSDEDVSKYYNRIKAKLGF